MIRSSKSRAPASRLRRSYASNTEAIVSSYGLLAMALNSAGESTRSFALPIALAIARGANRFRSRSSSLQMLEISRSVSASS